MSSFGCITMIHYLFELHGGSVGLHGDALGHGAGEAWGGGSWQLEKINTMQLRFQMRGPVLV